MPTWTSLALYTLTVTCTAYALTPNNLLEPSTSGPLSALRYTGVGGSGQYSQVTDLVAGSWPSCTVSDSCQTTTKEVSGNLAPFDEDITVVFRGPINIANIAVYQPANTSSSSWNLVSSWSAGSKPTNLVFMNNDGGDVSGTWSVCGGSSQSYASGDFTGAVSSPNADISQGYLPSGKETNIMTATECTDSSVCEGFYRGTANAGWSGSKMFVFEVEMPSNGSSSDQPPAIWALNSQIVRSAQYGCNCRGTGAGGCGELDLIENLSSNPDQGISEIYSFKGATGSGDGAYFARPTDGKQTYGVIFDVKTDQITIQNWSSWDWSTSSVARSLIDGYLTATAKVVSFASSSRMVRRAHHPRSGSFFGAHRRNHV